MANTKRMNQVLEKIGFEPEEGKAIVVSYAPENLSDRIKRLLSFTNFYALSFCKESIVLLPFSTGWADVRTIAGELRLSRATVFRTLDDLCKAGLLEKGDRWRENGGRTSNLYKIL